MEILSEKKQKLREILLSLGNTAVAYSAGVDSTFLARFTHDVLGDKMIAITANGAFMPKREYSASVSFCKENGIRHEVINVDPLKIKEFRENRSDRCYHCKKNIFTLIKQTAEKNGFFNVIDGSNVNDLSDYRPGMKALEELSVISPLRDAGLTKNDIRDLSRELGLPTADKPSFACLATRIPCGEEITIQKLEMADAAEQKLFELGFKQFRVRFNGSDARIEIIPEDFPLMAERETTAEVNSYLKGLGFRFVTLDLGGYRMGSTNLIQP